MMITATAPAMTNDAVQLGRLLGGAVDDALVPVALEAVPDWDGVVSPFALDELPRSELAKLHN